MKRLKFLILALGLIMAHGIFAVTLPSTSYTPYSGSDGSASEATGGGFSIVKGSYLQLADGDADYSACEGDGNGYTKNNPGQTCADCCKSLIPGTSIADFESRAACVAYCEPGPALPLDAPLWYMLALAALGSALAVTLRVAKTY